MNRILAALLFVSFMQGAGAAEPVAGSLADVSFEAVMSQPVRPSDHRLSYGEDPLQVGELWLPAAGAPARPLVILIHGGCWLNAYDISHTYGFSTALAAAGYPVWSLEYRRTGDPGGGWPGTFEDIRAGISRASQLRELGVDLDRIVLMGHSAGGHLALLAATDSVAEDLGIDLVVGLAAITDVAAYSMGTNSCETVTPAFMGGTADEIPRAYAAANPGSHVLRSRAVLLQGDIDQIVPQSQARLAGAPTRMTAGAGHFDWIHAGSRAYADLLELLGSEF